VAVDAMSSVIQELFGNVASLFYSPPHYVCAVLYRIGNRAGRTRSLVGRFGNVFGSSFHYGL
jgi:hypothetical protein